MQKFVIVTLPRSGSYHLVSLLNSADDICCFGEVFKRKYVELPTTYLKPLGMSVRSTAKRDANPIAFLEKAFVQQEQPIIGFKAFPEHLRRVGLEELLQDPSWKKIFLTRNPVATFVSNVRAEQTGVFVAQQASKYSNDELNRPVTVNVQTLLDRIEWQQSLYRRWRRLAREATDRSVIVIDYRHLDYIRRRKQLLAFLGSSAQPKALKSSQRRQFTRAFSDGIENYEEVKIALEAQGKVSLLKQLETGTATRSS